MKRLIPIIIMIVCQACLLGRSSGADVTAGPSTSSPTRTPVVNTPVAIPSVTDAPTSATKPLADICRNDVDGIRALLDGLELPEHFGYQDEGDAVPHEGDFDPTSFFTVLTHLRMQPDYVLDYVFADGGLGGNPLVYARKESYQRFTTVDEYQQMQQYITPDSSFFAALYPSYAYLDRVLIDGSPESYLEYLLLANYGSQWYLVWHANYNDTMILCDPSDLDRANAEATAFGNDAGLPADIKSAAQQLDLAPTVALTENQVIVHYVFFTKWGGFIEEIYTLDRANPYKVIDRTTHTLVEYNCGVMF